MEALDALEKIKPVLDEAYSQYLKKMNSVNKQVEKPKPVTQWQPQQQPSNQVSNSTKEWNLQDALKGVVGVGYGEGTK
jgi:uncharacterized protein